MNLLSVENLSKSYGAKVLFENISFGINKGEKVALIARNGFGKTTLINILKGKEIGDTGKVVMRKDLVISFLEQEPAFDPDKTILETLSESKNKITAVIEEYHQLVEKANTDHSTATLSRLDNSLVASMALPKSCADCSKLSTPGSKEHPDP